MTKRILSILLTVCMVICLMPAALLAEAGNADISVGTEAELVAALEDTTVNLIKLKNDIGIGATLNVDRAVTLDLVGYMLEMTGSGSVIRVADGGHLTLRDSDPDAKYTFRPDANGVWKWASNGEKIVNGGVICGGTGNSGGNGVCGGGVYVDENGMFTMSGGNIVGCTAVVTNDVARGGGVYIAENGTFTMNGGSIAGCTAVASVVYGWAFGGGIRNEGTATLSGAAEIRDCHVKGEGILYGGGISDGKLLNISGNVRITGCTAGSHESGAMYVLDGVISGGTFDGTVQNYGTITGGTFNGMVTNEGTITGGTFNGKVINEGTITGGMFYGGITGNGAVSGVTRQVTTWGELKDALADANVDVVRLAAGDIYPGGAYTTLYIERTVTLDLNGYVLKGDGRSVFEIKAGGHLIVTDSRPTEKHKFLVNNNYSYGVWQWDDLRGDEDKTAYGGVINGGGDIEGGGGVKVRDGGRLTMNGGSIVGCSSSDAEGGGVKVYAGGEFELNGDAAIIGCVTNRDGGGVYVEDGGTFTMNGGTIRDCMARGGNGGGVCNDGQFTMNGGTIRSCTAYMGGAVYHDSSTPLILNGTIISDNSNVLEPIYAQCGTRSTVIIGADADIQANMYLSDFTVHANGGIIRGDLYAHWAITISVDEGVTQGTIFYGKLTGNCNINVNGVAVTYQVNGADYATQFLNSGSTAAKPAAPTDKTGYTFDGWYKADGTKWDFNTAVTESTTLTGWQYLPVDNASALESAMADDTVDVIRLTKDIDINSTLTILRPVTLDLNGYVLRYANTNTVGSVFKIVTGGDLTVIDSRPEAEHKFNGDDVLWVLDEQNGKETVKGGVITGGTGTLYYPDATLTYTSKLGGGVYMEGGQFTMNGGNIVGCKAHTGGGVYILKNGAFTMNGGSIVGCLGILVDAGWNPLFGGVYLCDGGTFTMTGGVIKSSTVYSVNLDNATMNANGGEIYGGVEADENSSVTCLDGLTGVTAFRDWVTLRNRNGNIDHVDWGLFYGKLYALEVSISGLTVAYKDGDTDYAKQILTSGKTATRPDDPAKPGYSFDGWYTADGTPWDYTTPVTADMTLTAHWTINTRDVTNEQELTDALADTSVGQIRLTADIDISKELPVTRTVILDLNGHVLRQITDKCVSFKVENGADLTIIDSDPTAEHRFTPDGDGLWVWDETGGTKTVKGGIITGNAQGKSGSIHVAEGAFTMNGGNLVGCNVYGASSSIGISCGAVYVTANSRFTMNGGTIQGCLVRRGHGGGVYVNGGQFTMNGGAITDCTVDSMGGGVFVDTGTFKLVDGDIRNCKADFGGGVCVRPSVLNGVEGIFEMIGGSISDCTAQTKGSALVIDGNALDNVGVTLYDIGGTMYAGGGTVDGTVYIQRYGKITTGSGITGVTSFKKEVIAKAVGSEIEYGIYYGGITGEGTVSGVNVTYQFDGAEYAKQVLPGAGLATRPDDPAAIKGYTFDSWCKSDGTAWDYANDTVTGEITLYAKLTPNIYTLTFDANGGSDVTPKTRDVTYGEPLGELPVPVREGYVFLGWFDDQGAKQYDATTQLDRDENLTLYAHWEELCTIRFETNGGTMNKPDPVTQRKNEPVVKPDDPARTGYTFAGWYKDAACTQAWKFDDPVTGDMTLYAGWTVNRYTITVKPENGEKDIVITQDFGTDVTLPNLTKTGYTFTGWDKAVPKTMPAENMTITAQWKDTGKPTGEISIDTSSWKTLLNNITFGLFFKDTQKVTITAADNSGEQVKIEYLLSDQEFTEAELANAAFTEYTGSFGINPDNEYIVYAKLTDKAGNVTYICSEGIVLDGTNPVISGITDGRTYCEAQTVTITEKSVDAVTVNGTAVTLDSNNSFVLAPADGSQKIVVTDKAGNTTEMTVTVNDGHTFGAWASNGDGTHTRQCTVSGCTADAETENCSGGKATCKDKAICEVCGKSYGKIDAENHTGLKHIKAKAATKASGGNIEYWYCKDCGKYYKDASATKEISKAETRTKKLSEDPKPDPKPDTSTEKQPEDPKPDTATEQQSEDKTSPKTGDNSNLMLWITLLFISGGAAIGTTVVYRKKKYKG